MLDVPLRLESPLRSPFVIVHHAVALARGGDVPRHRTAHRRPRAATIERATVFYALALVTAVAILGRAPRSTRARRRGIIVSPFPTFTTIYVVMAVRALRIRR